jgi:hypothetical protein
MMYDETRETSYDGTARGEGKLPYLPLQVSTAVKWPVSLRLVLNEGVSIGEYRWIYLVVCAQWPPPLFLYGIGEARLCYGSTLPHLHYITCKRWYLLINGCFLLQAILKYAPSLNNSQQYIQAEIMHTEYPLAYAPRVK